MRSRGLTNLLKIHHWFGFGPLRIDEKIGDFFVEDVLVDGRQVHYYLRERSSWAPKEVVRARGSWIYNAVGHFLARCDIKNNYLGQPAYKKEQRQYNQRDEERSREGSCSSQEDEGDGWLEIRWRN